MRPSEIQPPQAAAAAGQVPTAPSATPVAPAIPDATEAKPTADATKVPTGPTKVSYEAGAVNGTVLGKAIKQVPKQVGSSKPLIKPKAIVFHSSAATQNQDELADSLSGKGYHFTIGRDGTVAQHWSTDQIAYHAREGGYNFRSIGISLVGTDNDRGGGARYVSGDSRTTLPATKAQLAAAKALVEQLQTIYPTIKEFKGHGETDPGNKAADEGLDVARFLRGEPIDPSKDA